MPRNENYRADLLDDLRNEHGFALAYLRAAIADSREAFFAALRDVVEAGCGMTEVASEANVNRENLYRALSKRGNPRFSTLEGVLDALGMDFTVQLKQGHAPSMDPNKTNTHELISAGSTAPLLSAPMKTKTPIGWYLSNSGVNSEQLFVDYLKTGAQIAA